MCIEATSKFKPKLGSVDVLFQGKTYLTILSTGELNAYLYIAVLFLCSLLEVVY